VGTTISSAALPDLDKDDGMPKLERDDKVQK